VENVTLEIEARSELGKGASMRLRRRGLLPVVVYAHGKQAIPASVNRKDFVQAAQRARTSSIFVLKSKDSSLNGKHAFVKEIQQNFVKKEVLHVDFLAVDENETARVKVPVEVLGEADGVKNQGGVLAVINHYVVVKARPANVPEMLRVDVSALKLGDRVRAGDVELPEGVELCSDAEAPIASVIVARTAKLAEPTEAAAEGAEEGAAAEGAEEGEGAAEGKKAEGKKGEGKKEAD